MGIIKTVGKVSFGKYSQKKTKPIETVKNNRGGRKGTPLEAFSEKLDLDCIKGNTPLGKSVRGIIAHLREYAGKKRNILSDLLILQISYKVVRLLRYQMNNLNNKDDVENPQFLPMSNSLRADVQELQKMTQKNEPPALEEYLEAHYDFGKEKEDPE